MVNRKFIPLRSHCCSGGAIHSPYTQFRNSDVLHHTINNTEHRRGKTPCSALPLCTPQAASLPPPLKQQACFPAAPSIVPCAASLVRIPKCILLGHEMLHLAVGTTGRKPGSYKSFKRISSSPGKQCYSLFSTKSSCKTQSPPLSNQEGTCFIPVVSSLTLSRLSEATP